MRRAVHPHPHRAGAGLLGLLGLVGLLGLAAGACGGTDSGDGFDPTMAYPTAAGRYSLQAAREPDPPRKGLNAFMLSLKGADGLPVDAAEIEIEPWMPAHGHGTTKVQLEQHGNGEYSTDELYFNMAGRWEIRIAIDGPYGSDRVALDFKVR